MIKPKSAIALSGGRSSAAMSRLCDPPSVKKIRAFGKKILGFNLPLQNPKYPGWQNQLHEIGHWAVIPPAILDEWSSDRRLRHRGDIPAITGLDLANWAAQKLIGIWFEDALMMTIDSETNVVQMGAPMYAHYAWLGDSWQRRAAYCLKCGDSEKYIKDAIPLIPNEWGVVAWCNQVCTAMGWPNTERRGYAENDPDPHQLLVAGIDIENGIFRPSHQYSISFLEVGPRLEICRPNTGEIVQSRTAHYWPGVFKPETEIVGKAYIWRA